MSQAFLWQSFSHTNTDIYEMRQPFLTIFAHSYMFLLLIKDFKHFLCTCRCATADLKDGTIPFMNNSIYVFLLITLRSSAKMYPDCKTTLNFTPYIYTLITTIFQEKSIKYCTVSKWRPNNRFSFLVISILAKIWKTSFPKVFFNEIWLKLEDYEYINIAEMTFGLFYSEAILGANQFFQTPKMLIYAN